MATYVGGSHGEMSSFYCRPSTTTTTTTTTASSVSANMGPTTTPTFSKASEGLRCSSSDIHKYQEYAKDYRIKVRSQQSKSISDLSPRHNGRPSQYRTCA